MSPSLPATAAAEDRMDAPELTGAITYVVADQPNAVDRWHVLPDMTVI